MDQIKPASLFKRIFSGIVDSFIMLVVTFGLYYYPASSVYGEIFNVKALKEEYVSLQVDYGIYYLDGDGVYQLTEEGKNKDSEVYTLFANDERAKEIKDEEVTLFFIEFSTSITISELVFFLFIPLVLRNGQTIGKKMFSLIVVNDSFIKVRASNMIIRFVAILVVETLASMFLYGVPLAMSILLVIFSKNHIAIHDFFGTTIIISKNGLYFDNAQERIEYDEKMAKSVIPEITNISK